MFQLLSPTSLNILIFNNFMKNSRWKKVNIEIIRKRYGKIDKKMDSRRKQEVGYFHRIEIAKFYNILKFKDNYKIIRFVFFI